MIEKQVQQNVIKKNNIVFFQEMLIIMLSDLANPDNLKTFDERFEIQLPLKNAKINFNSKVI